MVRVVSLDHVVIVTKDVERLLAWYRDDLGLAAEGVDEWRAGELPFPSVRVDATTIVDILAGEPTGKNVDHLCFVVSPGDIDAIVNSERFEVLAGPTPRSGARGVGTSVYVHDPDGNLVELRHYDGGT